MPLPRWLSALLIAALILSSSPAAALAAPHAPAAQQASSVAASTYLLVLNPPAVTVPPQAGAFDAAGYVNVEHARHYADVQAQLDSMQAQGAIAGYTAQPAAYAFVVNGATEAALAALGPLGRLQAQDEMGAAAVDELAAAYTRQLNAAVVDGTRQGAGEPAAPVLQRPGKPAPLPAGEKPLSEEAARMANAVDLAVAPAAVTPRFTVYLSQAYVYGYDLDVLTPVTLTLKGADGAIKGMNEATTTDGGWVYLYPKDIYGNDSKIVAGDVVEIQTPAPVSIPVVNLQAIPDAATGRVTGMAPANITSTVSSVLPTLRVEPGGLVTTTAEGGFVAGPMQLLPGDYWRVRYTNVDDHEIVLTYGIPSIAARGYYAPWDSAYYGETYVSGRVVMPNTPVTVTLTRPGAAPFVNFAFSDNGAGFAVNLQDQYGNDLPIQPGDVLQASDGLVTSSVTVPTFTVTSDPANDTLSGTTDATVITDTVRQSQSLSLWPTNLSEYAFGRTVLAPGGSFSAANPYYLNANANNSSAVLDWGNGQAGHLRYLDAERDAVFQQFRALSAEPILQVRSYGSSYVENAVSGVTSGPCTYGTVTLRDAANVVKDQNVVNTCYSFSTEFRDAYNNVLPILPGDSVEASFDGRSTKVTVPAWSMNANADTNVVAGQIEAGLVTTTTYGAPGSLAIYPYTSSYGTSRNVQPDGAGAFSADLTGLRDIQPGSEGVGVYIDAKGNSIFEMWEAPLPQPRLWLRGAGMYNADNFIQISWSYGSYCTSDPVQVVIKSPDGTVRWQDQFSFCSAIQRYLYDDFGNEVNLTAGDSVEATFGGQTTKVVVPSFDNVVSDPDTSTVSGVTNAEVTTTTVGMTRTLAVWPQGGPEYYYGKYIAVAAGGVFSVTNPFHWRADPDEGSAWLTWDVGQRGYFRYIDAGGNMIYAPFAAMTDRPLLSVNKDGNGVSGMLPASGVPVTVALMSGATVKGLGYDTSDDYGQFGISLFDGAGNPLEIAEGDQVMLADPAVTVNVPPLTAAVNTDAELVSGKGPANALLNVSQPESPLSVPSLSTSTDGEGNYAADFRGRADLTANSLVMVEHQNGDGHTVWIERLGGAMLSAALNTGRVWGYAPVEESIPIIVTVKRGGAVIGVDSLTDWGHFTAFPVDASGKPISLAAGDVIELDFGSGVVRTLTLAPLSLVVNDADNTLGGSGPAASRLGVELFSYSRIFNESVMTDAAGQWAVALTSKGADINAGNVATVRYSTDGIDTTWLFGIAPVFYIRQVQNNNVSGYAAPYTPVTVTLRRDGVALAVAYKTAEGGGYFDASLLDVNGLPADIKAGDVLEIKHAQTVAVTIPVLQVVLDSNARTVSGVGPANTRLGVVTSAGNKTVQTDGQGAFLAAFPNTSYLYSARLEYREPGGHWIFANVAERVGGVPYLRARWDWDEYEYRNNAVSGYTGAGPRTVELTLRRGGQVAAAVNTGADSDGYFSTRFLDADGKPVDIQPGDGIEMVAGDVSKSMTVPALSAQANQESNTLFGAGPANAPLETNMCGDTRVDPTGAWVVECDSTLGAGDGGYVYVTDLLGNRTYQIWNIPGLWVRQNSNRLTGTVALGAGVQVQLQRGGAVVAEASAEADAYNGWFDVNFFTSGGSPAIIQPNDVVVAAVGTQTITVPVGPLSAAVDIAVDKVNGAGPANQELAVYARVNGVYVARRLTTAADGSYSADFSGAADLRSGVYIEVVHINDAGHTIWMGWNTPQVRINLASDIVDGFATPNALARLALKRGGAVVATAQAQTAMDGRFSGFFLDGAGNVIDLVAGDMVEVTASPTVAAAAIALTASLNPATDKVTGNAPPASALLVTAYRCWLSGCSESQLTAVAGADGAYTADFSGSFDLDQTSYAYVQATDAEGNQTSITTLPAETPRLQRLEANLATTGATLLKSGAGAANAGNLSTPLLVNVLGGGRLVFRSFGGELVITAPDGTITRPGSVAFTLQNAAPGVWKVQVDLYDDAGEGAQYGVAVGQALYGIYMPTVAR